MKDDRDEPNRSRIKLHTRRVAKTLSFFVRASAQRGSSLANLNHFAPPVEMQSSRVVFPSPSLRRLRCALHSDNSRSLRSAPSASHESLSDCPRKLRGNRHRLRVNRASIVWLAARRQGSIVPPSPADLHLDCARSPGRGRYGFTRKESAVQRRIKEEHSRAEALRLPNPTDLSPCGILAWT